MTRQWSEGYITGVPYTYGYYNELSPAWMRFCLLMRRITPPPAQDYAYCELGFGQGLSLNMHAAAGAGAFHGTDFTPEHAAFAANLAGKSGGACNIYDDSFEEFLERDLPTFDYIGMHGVWSWVSDDNRRHIVDFVKKNLKAGGVFYVSYNSMPGWGAAGPLGRLLALHERIAPHTSHAARARDALAFCDSLFEAGPAYLQSATGLRERLENLKKHSPDYIAHEYFNSNWDTMYFVDVADRLAQAKLRFAASAVPSGNISGFGLTDRAREFLSGIEDTVMYRQMQDYFENTQFHKDLYVRGGVALTPQRQRELFLRERFVLLRHPDDIAYTMNMGMGTITLDKEAYKPVVAALAAEEFAPKPLAAIWEADGLARGLPDLLGAIANLVTLGAVSPCQPEEVARQNRSRTRACNAALSEMTLAGHFFVSPVTGGGVNVSRLEQLFLAAPLSEGGDAVKRALEKLARNGEKLLAEGRPVEDGQQAARMMEETYAEFRDKRLPLLKALDIV
ncbi:MAG: methyltransferase regulatory domain-containing protein [Desulfovibrio sp.]|jgi:SAM-dependent methyltransferase|nr:methyltransferase regulatory domain-containing protein [Desulfovibrio sp.]